MPLAAIKHHWLHEWVEAPIPPVVLVIRQRLRAALDHIGLKGEVKTVGLDGEIS